MPVQGGGANAQLAEAVEFGLEFVGAQRQADAVGTLAGRDADREHQRAVRVGLRRADRGGVRRHRIGHHAQVGLGRPVHPPLERAVVEQPDEGFEKGLFAARETLKGKP